MHSPPLTLSLASYIDSKTKSAGRAIVLFEGHAVLCTSRDPAQTTQKGRQMPSTVILATARTPFGKMGGTLSSLDATDLGGRAIGAALERSGVDPEQVQQVVFGQVLHAGQGQIPSRQAQIKG